MRTRTLSLLGAALVVGACTSSTASDESTSSSESSLGAILQGELLPTSVRITPTATPGSTFEPLLPGIPAAPGFKAGQPVATAISPDGKTLLVLTSGYNRWNGPDGRGLAAASNEYVFVYDVGTGAAVQRQAIQVPNAFNGVAWSPNGKEFYASGGPDDFLRVFAADASGTFALAASIALGHTAGLGLLDTPAAAGVGVSQDGTRAVVANFENDSVTIVDLTLRKVVREIDLRPGKIDPAMKGVAGGEFPFGVAVHANDKAYVSSERDGEVVVIDLAQAKVSARVRVGRQPSKLLLDKSGARLFVANSSSDSVAILDTRTDKVVEVIPVLANEGGFKGANPNGLALSPDERTLYVTTGGTNAVAIVRLGDGDGDDDDDDRSRVVGLIPTGWYPNSVSVSADGSRLYVVNGKTNAGPNDDACRNSLSTASSANTACNATNEYVWQLTHGGLLTLPVPHGHELARLSWQVAVNNRFPEATHRGHHERVMQHLRHRIHHVVYIVKENRTYDQVLGDLGRGDGDATLTLFPEPLTPNHHAIARTFVTLDRFEDSGEVSGDGWNWSTSARTTDFTEKTVPINYAGRGLTYDWEGTNRNVNVGFSALADRIASNPYTPADPDLLPGAVDVAAAAAPGADGEAGAVSYLWDAALRAGLSVRNYGFFGDLTRYSLPAADPGLLPLDRTPSAHALKVFYASKASLEAVSDPFFRGYDQSFPDYWRFKEWEREFDAYAVSGELPALELVRFPHDHFGNFGTAIDGINTPDRQMADNDYAVGLLVDKIAKSRFANDTVVFVLEDDAQNGPDHVDAHRSIGLVAGAFVKQGDVVSTPYSTVNALRTIESLLGFEPMGITDAFADPMTDVFDVSRTAPAWSYDALVPELLRTSSQLPLPPRTVTNALTLTPNVLQSATSPHDAAYWAEQTRDQDFTKEDRLDTAKFNHVLWRGLKGEGK